MNDARKRVWLLGCGRMGRVLLRGWQRGGIIADYTVIDPKAASLANEFAGANFTAAVPDGHADILVIALKPQKIPTILPAYHRHLAADSAVLSVAAGYGCAAISADLQLNDSARVARAMPNLPAALGQGISGFYAPPALPRRADCLELLAVLGPILELVQEDALHAVTALSGSGPAYVFYLLEAMVMAAQAVGLSADEGKVLARQTIIGAAAMLAESPDDAAALRAQVTSPGGTTAAAMAVLTEQNRFAEILRTAITQAQLRSRELADG